MDIEDIFYFLRFLNCRNIILLPIFCHLLWRFWFAMRHTIILITPHERAAVTFRTKRDILPCLLPNSLFCCFVSSTLLVDAFLFLPHISQFNILLSKKELQQVLPDIGLNGEELYVEYWFIPKKYISTWPFSQIHFLYLRNF